MKRVLLVGLVAVVAISLVAYGLQPNTESTNLDMERSHGSISTSLGSPILGDLDAPITIVEFGDYQCHQCHNWFHNTKPSLSRDYIDTGKVNLVFIDMAFLGRESPIAAQASYCAEDQGKYWEYHNQLYDAQQPTIDNGWANKANLKEMALYIGLDTDLFDTCLDSNKYQKRVRDNISEARSYGVSGTPTFAIISQDGSDTKLVGAQPYSVFKRTIDQLI